MWEIGSKVVLVIDIFFLSFFVVLFYIQSISKTIGRILRQEENKVEYKPLKTVCFRAERLRMMLTTQNPAQYTKSVAPTAILYTTVKRSVFKEVCQPAQSSMA